MKKYFKTGDPGVTPNIKPSKYDKDKIKAKAKDMKDPDWQRKHRKELD